MCPAETRPQKVSDFDCRVDRDVLIAIARVKYRAGTARSTLPDVQKLLVIGITPANIKGLAHRFEGPEP